MMDRFQQIRLLEAILFASAEPLRAADLAKFLPDGAEVSALLEELAGLYANRGVHLVRVGDRWAFRSAADLADLMRLEKPVKRKLSRAAVETLAIVAYHQPVTRAEIEEIRGVGLSRGTLDTLLEMGWIKPRGRRRTPGRPVTWGTTDAFLDHFGLESLDALPGQEELKAAGLLDTRPAITSLAARGLLPPGGAEGEESGEGEDDEALTDEEAAALLDAEFGEDLVPSVDEGADRPDDGADAAAADANGDDDEDDEYDDDEEDEEDEDEDDALIVQPAGDDAAVSEETVAEGAHEVAEESDEPDDALEAAADRTLGQVQSRPGEEDADGEGAQAMFSRVAVSRGGEHS